MNAKQSASCEMELKKLRDFIRMQGDSIQTEESYVRNVRRFLSFLCSREWPEGTTSERVPSPIETLGIAI